MTTLETILHVVAFSMIIVGAAGMIFFRWRAEMIRREIHRRKMAGTWAGKS